MKNLALALLLCGSAACLAQNSGDSDPELVKILTVQDAKLFTAVNTCDMKTVESMFAPDVEFYHDQADPQYGRAVVVENIRRTFCGGEVQRQLVPGTLEAYRIQKYGAVEIGVHRFLHPKAADHGVIGEAKFIHLWKYNDGNWQITRVISIAHHSVDTPPK